jgi:hypothetical protein
MLHPALKSSSCSISGAAQIQEEERVISQATDLSRWALQRNMLARTAKHGGQNDSIDRWLHHHT